MLNPDKKVHTTCPYCGVGCQIDVLMRNDFIFRIEGRFDNQVNYGNLCVKGRFGLDFIHAPDRLTEPLVRKGKDGELQPASWADSLDLVAKRFGEIRDQYGPDSIAILASAKATDEENYLIQKFARAVIGTNNIDHCARL